MNLLRVSAVAALMLLAGTAAAKDAGVRFEVKFSGRLDCTRPNEFSNAPVSVKAVAVMKPDGTAVGTMTMTAYYLLSWKVDVAGKLGAKPQKEPYGTVQLKVLDRNGLALTVGLPNHESVVNIRTQDNETCTAEMINRLRPGKTEYSLYAGDEFHYCSRLVVQNASCKVS